MRVLPLSAPSVIASSGRLVSPYQTTDLKIFRILDGVRYWRGVGLDVRLNGKYTVHLLLDTGASGIAISPKMAEKAGLEIVNGAGFEAKGHWRRGGPVVAQICCAGTQNWRRRLCRLSAFRVPVGEIRRRRRTHRRGRVSPVYRENRFRPACHVTGRASHGGESDSANDPWEDEPVDHPGNPAPGFYRVFRFGDHLAVPTHINGGRPVLFLIDSGSTLNLIDTETAKEFTKVTDDSRATVKGLQGTVHRTSLANRRHSAVRRFTAGESSPADNQPRKNERRNGRGLRRHPGMPVLGNLAVTIDYLEGAIRFEYNPLH